jgi:beta-N-acetylhexosaminidase
METMHRHENNGIPADENKGNRIGQTRLWPVLPRLVLVMMISVVLLLGDTFFTRWLEQHGAVYPDPTPVIPTPVDTSNRVQLPLIVDPNQPVSSATPSLPVIATATPPPTKARLVTEITATIVQEPEETASFSDSATATAEAVAQAEKAGHTEAQATAAVVQELEETVPSSGSATATAEAVAQAEKAGHTEAQATAAAVQGVATPKPDVGPSDEDVRSQVSQMPLADKVGQMMMVGFHGKSLSESPELLTLVSTYHVGSIVLLEANAHDPQQVTRLIAEAQDSAIQTGSHIPLFVAINHEGGIVVRITEGVTGFPGNMAIAATGEPEYAYTAASLAAQELRAMGINMNLAPVLDVNDNPLNPIIGVRSFGESADLAVSLGRETIRGFQENGIVAVAKHFPGHGSAAVDSHVGLPLINKPLSQLEEVELPPFQMAVEEGVEAIMTAHIVVPVLESTTGLPASLSANILTGLLRDRMGFRGIIVTDSLGMGAITARWGQAQAAVEAVKAGADMVLSTGPLEAQIAIHRALGTAVQNGEISAEWIDESVFRILRVKHKYGLFEWKPSADLSLVGSEEHQAAADDMSLAAVTLVRNDAGLVPLPEGSRRLLILSPDELPPASTGHGTLLAQELRQQGFEVTELVFNLNLSSSRDTAYAEALRLAPLSDLVVFGEWELVKRYANWSDQWQEQLIAALQQSGKPVIVIAWRDPGAILRVSQMPTFLTAYGTTAGQVRAVAKVLTGQAEAQGSLPLTIPLP